MPESTETDRFARELHRIGAVRFGEFTLKSGRRSPIYVDLRGLVSYPEVLRLAGRLLVDQLAPLRFDRIAGLPYAGLPLAVAASLEGGLPMIYARKEVKDYGTRRLIEGDWTPGQTVALVDDVITDGGAKIELVAPFREAGLTVRDVVVLVDREQGGREALQAAGLRLHALLTLAELMSSLREQGCVDEETCAEVARYLESGS